MKFKRAFVGVCCAVGLATCALAQPAVEADLGSLTSDTIYSGTVTGISPTAQTKWIKFTIGPVVRTNADFLDITFNGGSLTGTDSMMGLYDNAGNRVATDDDDGPSAYSQLSVGSTASRGTIAPTGNATSAGVALDGRDGTTLAPGTYWLAFTGFGGTTFGTTNWNVTTSHTRSGDITYRIQWHFTPPSVPTGSGSVAPTTVSNCGTASTLVSVATTPVGPPNPSTDITVVADLSAIGGSPSQSLFDDGTNGDVAAGDGRYSYLQTVPNTVTPGLKSIPFTVADAQGRSSTGTISGPTVTRCPLPNSSCAQAIPLSPGSPTSGYVTGSEPLSTVPTCGTASGSGLWYLVTGNGNTFSASTCNSGTTFDTIVGVYCGINGCTGLTCIGGNDDAACTFSGLHSTFSWCTVPNAPYYIFVRGFSTATGDFVLTVNDDATPCTGPIACNFPPPPGNDSCAGAERIQFDTPTAGYLTPLSGPSIAYSCGPLDEDQRANWYAVTGTGHFITVSTDVPGTLMDTVLAVYCANDGCDNLLCIGGDDDGGTGTTSLFSFCSSISATYYIAVGGFADATGNYVLSVTDGTDPCSNVVGCEPRGACCIPALQICEILTRDRCVNRGGNYQGDGTECESLSDFGDPIASSDTFPIDIPDSGSASSSVAVTTGQTVGAVQVCVGLTHTFSGDLIVTLSNGARSAVLMNRVGGGRDLAGVYCFNDFTPDTITGSVGDPIPAGTYLPAESLGVFAGDPTDGVWTVTVSDNAGLDIGTIDSLTIQFAVTVGNCDYCPPCPADYNQDGGVDGSDVAAFFEDWENGTGCADVNDDGGIDGADAQTFFGFWKNGGCN